VGVCIQAVPLTSDSFESRKKLPAAWCGLRDSALSAQVRACRGVLGFECVCVERGGGKHLRSHQRLHRRPRQQSRGHRDGLQGFDLTLVVPNYRLCLKKKTKMTILYCLVSRKKSVLAEHTSSSGNFPTVTRVLLAKIPEHDSKMSYVYDKYVFHYIVDQGITFLCMSDESTKRRIAFSFLEDVLGLWRERYAATEQSAIAFSMNEAFSPILKARSVRLTNKIVFIACIIMLILLTGFL